ncbi:polyphosphate kinase 2 family protein, partial [Paraglaciecola sp.]|uniref:polyphosphate kinase 2 family protein n=1 Tax=Paraglaciecola sp. TaxID=1920173 RepID=UPI003EF27C53
PEFEKMLLGSGIKLVKYWFSVSQQTQEKRFKERLNNPLKRWKFSDMDLVSRSKWNQYSRAKDEMLKHTDTNLSPWYNIEADNKKAARVNCISHLLSLIDYQYLEQKTVTLPNVSTNEIKRLDKSCLRTVPPKYKEG